MNPILQNSTARIWGLSGLTLMVFMAGILLDEGQARTYSPSPGNSSTQTHRLSHRLQSSDSMKRVKVESIQSSSKRTTTKSLIQKEGTDQTPGKKRMGLAILFLGILAEEG